MHPEEQGFINSIRVIHEPRLGIAMISHADSSALEQSGYESNVSWNVNLRDNRLRLNHGFRGFRDLLFDVGRRLTSNSSNV